MHILYNMCMYALHINNYMYKNNKKHFNKNERRCRDVKTQKARKQGLEANIGPKITSI